jgi:putative ABC transport system substrate-binding protein
MNRRIFNWLIATFFLATVSLADAQPAKKVARVGFVLEAGNPTSPSANVAALRQGLRENGYVEGENIIIEFRYAEGKPERVPSLVAELVQLNVDVIISQPTAGIRAAKQATKTIPIVMVTVQDPVETGLIDSMAHPGGNVTGLTRLTVALSGKRLELLKEVIPGISRVGVLWDADGTGIGVTGYKASAPTLNLQLQSLEVRGPNPDFDGAFQAAAKGEASALITVTGGLLNRYPKLIADLAIRNRLPSMYERNSFVEAGGLVSFAPNDAESYRRAAYFVDKILKGAKPADLPVEQPTKFELIFNLKTAQQIGLTIPPNVLVRADRVIR